MSLSTAEIEAIVRDLKPRLEGGRIERVDQPRPDRLVLTVRSGPALYWLLLCVHARFSRLHLLTRRPEAGAPAAGFCNAVRQHLTGALLRKLRQVPGDRVVVLESEERDRLMQPHAVTLVAELVGVGSNLVLLDESERILAVLTREASERRTLAPGAVYEPLEAPGSLPAKARVNRFADAANADDPLALSGAVQAHYAEAEAAHALERNRAELLQVLGSALKGRRRRLRRIEKDLQVAQNAEQMRRRGELLKIALPHIERGQGKVTVEDLFDPARPEVTIELDPALSPQENAERIFRRYKKAKAAQGRLAARAEQTRTEAARIEGLLGSARDATSPEQLRAVQSTVGEMGLTRPAEMARPRTAREGRGPRAFRSADGLEILVARNARENRRLTFTLARGNDYWMHLVDWPGPHVVIRKPPEREVSRQALLDAAHLAVHFSKIRGAEHAEVVYTQCKHVRRLKGAGPGKVSYSDAATLRVRVEPERIERLVSGRPPPGRAPGAT